MAMRAKAGIGTASLQPVLVDGWMLTSLQGSADSKVAETLTAVAGIVAAQKGNAGTSTDKSDKGKAGGGGQANQAKKDRALPPGLYALTYDSGGLLTGVCAVAYFSDDRASGNVTSCPAQPKPPGATHAP